VTINLVIIDVYFIGGYWWLLVAILLVAFGGYFIGAYY
jgi:hypothetical protein